jgi:hypothetical protein
MPVELKITIDDSGRFSVSGPIENKMMCYGLLEMARDAIVDHCAKNQSLITPVSMVPPSFPGMKS